MHCVVSMISMSFSIQTYVYLNLNLFHNCTKMITPCINIIIVECIDIEKGCGAARKKVSLGFVRQYIIMLHCKGNVDVGNVAMCFSIHSSQCLHYFLGMKQLRYQFRQRMLTHASPGSDQTSERGRTVRR